MFIIWQVNTLTDYRIKKLRENVNYTVWVIAANEKGSSQPINKKSVLVKSKALRIQASYSFIS